MLQSAPTRRSKSLPTWWAAMSMTPRSSVVFPRLRCYALQPRRSRPCGLLISLIAMLTRGFLKCAMPRAMNWCSARCIIRSQLAPRPTPSGWRWGGVLELDRAPAACRALGHAEEIVEIPNLHHAPGRWLAVAGQCGVEAQGLGLVRKLSVALQAGPRAVVRRTFGLGGSASDRDANPRTAHGIAAAYPIAAGAGPV